VLRGREAGRTPLARECSHAYCTKNNFLKRDKIVSDTLIRLLIRLFVKALVYSNVSKPRVIHTRTPTH